MEMAKQKVYRINLHMHTTDSDGKLTPEEAVRFYRDAGYDAVAITDHWKVGMTREIDGFPVFAGCEYNFGGNDTAGEGVYHVVALCYERDPGVTKQDSVQTCVDKIHAAGGIAVLGHPAWSVNLPEKVKEIRGFDATEIHNSVSGEGESSRPYSGAFVDMMAAYGVYYPLLSTDDVHYYKADGACGAILVSMPELSGEALKEAIRSANFYAVKGGIDAPEMHITREENTVHLSCSPVSEINIFSNAAWKKGRHVKGKDLTGTSYTFSDEERHLRFEITDDCGRTAYSCFLVKD